MRMSQNMSLRKLRRCEELSWRPSDVNVTLCWKFSVSETEKKCRGYIYITVRLCHSAKSQVLRPCAIQSYKVYQCWGDKFRLSCSDSPLLEINNIEVDSAIWSVSKDGFLRTVAPSGTILAIHALVASIGPLRILQREKRRLNYLWGELILGDLHRVM